MVDVSVDDGRVLFEVEGLHRLWTLKSRLEFPLAHVTAVEINHEQVGNWWHGFKLLGTEMPGVLGCGTFVYHGQMVFWDVREPQKTIIVSLEHEFYKKLIVEVADPPAVAAMLQSALRQ
jgi:hypothetical protein